MYQGRIRASSEIAGKPKSEKRLGAGSFGVMRRTGNVAMKTFRELYIHLHGTDADKFKEDLTGRCQAPWERREDKEEDAGYLGEMPLCFELTGDTSIPSALLFMFSTDGDSWYVSNIIPSEVSELDHNQYNIVLEHFLENVVRPAVDGSTIETEITSNEISVGSVAGDEVEEALVYFSTGANKSTGTSHPSDRKRWFEFLVLANEARSELNADLVIRALMELGWSEDGAYELGSQFERADGLLSYVQER